jgi:hypothetical protein
MFVFYILLPVIQNYRFWDTDNYLRENRIKHIILRKKHFLIYI